MRLKIKDCFPTDVLGIAASLDLYEVQGKTLALEGGFTLLDDTREQALRLVITSGPNSWSWTPQAMEGELRFRGHLDAADLSGEISLAIHNLEIRTAWLTLEILRSKAGAEGQWRDFFSGQASALPGPDLGAVANRAMRAVQVHSAAACPGPVEAFCRSAASRELVNEAARLRRQGRFPSVLNLENGHVLASRLVLNWNVLLIREGAQRFLVIQGVSSSDALLLPGLNLILLVCHIDARRVVNCLKILCRSPEFFYPAKPAVFGGYLVGHSRPYHCFYDGLLALQSVREAGELTPRDALFSKEDEAFIDLSAGLGLQQPHQLRSKAELNELTHARGCYLLQLGFWFHTRAENPEFRSLAAAVDQPLRDFAVAASSLATSGALEALERCEPLLWVGITGQKRSWLEQVDGTAALLNTLHEVFPGLGVVFDGWTPPLVSSDYHRQEARNDDTVIRHIIRRLSFRCRGRVGVIAGLPLLEKVRVGLAVDAFVANYTTGSLNVARICGKPGVGHMGCRMMPSKHQHIHHHTREIDSSYVQDRGDPGTPTGYVNYSIPWQAVFNTLLEVLADLPMRPSKPLEPLPLPELP